MVDEPLGGEPAEQPLDDAVLQVEVDDVLVHRAGVLEDDRPDRRLPAPFPGLLVALAGSAERVHRLGPGRVGPLALVEGRETRTRSMGLSQSSPVGERLQAARRASSAGRRRWRSGNGPRAGRCQSCEVFEPVLEPLDLGFQVFLTLAGRFQLLLDDLPVVGVRVRCLRAPLPSASMSRWRMPCLSVRASRPSSTWDRLPSSFLIVSVFRTRTSRMRSSLRSV